MCKFPKIVYWNLGTDGKKRQRVLTPDEEIFFRGQAPVGHFREFMVESCTPFEGYYERPCGKCSQCRLDQAREWSVRITAESQMYQPYYNWFVTLTYDDDNLKYRYVLGRPTADSDVCFEFCGSFANIKGMGFETRSVYFSNPWLDLDSLHCPTAVKSDLKTFVSSLRKHYERLNWTGIRFFACSEYGDKSFRPHYHLCILNMPISDNDINLYARNFQGDDLFNCPFIQNIWSKGYVVLARLDYKTAAYVARYTLKKQFSDDESGFISVYDGCEVDPPFTIMSTKPGIGKPYFDTHYEHIYQFDTVQLPNGFKCSPPRYFDKLYEKIDPDRLAAIKSKRAYNSAVDLDRVMAAVNLDEYEFFQNKSRRIDDNVKNLLRTL